MNDENLNQKKLWFKAKMYGWGWQPITWQGWVVTGVYIIGIFFSARVSDASSHSGSDALISFAVTFIILTSILLIICYKKGEKPRWRWGK